MKIFIPSYNRADTISTPQLLKGHDYTILVHDDQQAFEYRGNPTIDAGRIKVTNTPKGIRNQRQYILDMLVEPGEWYISLDDNIRAFTAVPKSKYYLRRLPVKEDKSLKSFFNTQITGDRFIEICEEMKKYGEEIGAYNIGFATTPNFFFRESKFLNVGYVISKAVVRKHTGIGFDPQFEALEDYAFTAQHLLQHGKVLVNNFVHPISTHYQKGGIGTYDERAPKKIVESKLLMDKYPYLFRYKKKAGKPLEAEIEVVPKNLKQLDKWRFFMKNKGME